MKPRWTSPPVTFNGEPLKPRSPKPRIELGPIEKLPRQRKPTREELAAVSDVTDLSISEVGI